MDTYLGIDYGGTKLLIGEVREDGDASEVQEISDRADGAGGNSGSSASVSR